MQIFFLHFFSRNDSQMTGQVGISKPARKGLVANNGEVAASTSTPPPLAAPVSDVVLFSCFFVIGFCLQDVVNDEKIPGNNIFFSGIKMFFFVKQFFSLNKSYFKKNRTIFFEKQYIRYSLGSGRTRKLHRD